MLKITPEAHFNTRIDKHPSQRQLHIQPVSEPLYVICAISNPQRYYNRYKHYHTFEKHVHDSGAILYTVELSLRHRHHEITHHGNHRHIQLRAYSELFHKENLINIGVRYLPHDWQNAAYIDADMIMTRPDWVVETVQMLQHYNWVQMFSTYSDIYKDHTSGPPHPSFAKLFKDGWIPGKLPYNQGSLWGAPGGGWAFRRSAYNDVGGLLDRCILGSADYHMAIGISASDNYHKEMRIGDPKYIEYLNAWIDRAKINKGSFGYIDNHAIHLYHGKRANRNYGTRSHILQRNHYDPYVDVVTDCQGVLEWARNKPKLEEEVRNYFKNRNEDE